MAKQTKAKDPIEQAEIEVREGEQSPNLPAVQSASAEQAVANVARATAPVPQGQLPVTGFANLATAIANIMTGIAEQRVEKRGENTFHHYKYATMQDILQKLTPLIAKEGIVIMQSEISRGFVDEGNAVQVTYEFTVMHKAGEVWPQKAVQTGVCNSRANNGKFDDKAINKCHTAARKYFLLALFQIPTEDEGDPDRGDNDGSPRKPAQSRDQRRTAHKPEASPPPREAVKIITPMVIDTKNEQGGFKKYVEWTGELVEQLNFADTLADLEKWLTLNAETITLMRESEKAKTVVARLDTVIGERREELAA